MRKPSLRILTCLFLLPALVDGVPAEEPPASVDVGAELARMYEEDQAERRGGKLSPARDAERLEQVRAWVRDDWLVDAEDFYHAAMIFQHSSDRSGRDHLLAHVLATTAAMKGHRRGRWLSAAALDRFLDFNDMPQFFATQFQRDDQGKWQPGDADPMLTPVLRAEFDIPSDAHLRERAAGFNKR